MIAQHFTVILSITLILIVTATTNLTQTGGLQMSEKIETCPCRTFPKERVWDEARWKKHWESMRLGHQKRLERIHNEARYGKDR